jgi:hypothetical protein
MSVEQVRSHLPQEMHASVGGLTAHRLIRLSGAINAPMGHNTLQKDRLDMTTKTITAIRTAIRAALITLQLKPFLIHPGTATWSAAAGHIRQKEP